MIPCPHPDKPTVDAAANALLKVAQVARKVPTEEQYTLADLTPLEKLHARTTALSGLTPAAPYYAAQVARALAADLDQAGEFVASTRLHEVANAWTSAAVPDDLSGLL